MWAAYKLFFKFIYAFKLPSFQQLTLEALKALSDSLDLEFRQGGGPYNRLLLSTFSMLTFSIEGHYVRFRCESRISCRIEGCQVYKTKGLYHYQVSLRVQLIELS